MAISIRDKNLQVVRKLCEEWAWMSRDDYRALLADDCVYVNIPFPGSERIGPDAAYELLKKWSPVGEITLKMLNIQGDDTVVLTERLESFIMKEDGKLVDLYCMGAFELKDGKIVKWRDYFERTQAPQMAPQATDKA